jgi:hypothetical protein
MRRPGPGMGGEDATLMKLTERQSIIAPATRKPRRTYAGMVIQCVRRGLETMCEAKRQSAIQPQSAPATMLRFIPRPR